MKFVNKRFETLNNDKKKMNFDYKNALYAIIHN